VVKFRPLASAFHPPNFEDNDELKVLRKYYREYLVGFSIGGCGGDLKIVARRPRVNNYASSSG
jgi:hypothetical protein